MNSEQDVISRTAAYVQTTLENEGSGHDWWHVYRVWGLARKIARTESVNALIVELAALLHDIADWKSHGGDSSVGPKVARVWLERIGAMPSVIDQVCQIVGSISYKGQADATMLVTREAMVVQDADRLDAMGAIGIARTFTYGGSRGRAIFDPRVMPVVHRNVAEYVGSTSPTVNHFYEKLLLLKSRMNTETGRTMAARRHEFMVAYLEELFTEWDEASDSRLDAEWHSHLGLLPNRCKPDSTEDGTA